MEKFVMLGRERCHDKCVEKAAHAECFLGTRLKTPILDQMVHKLTNLTYKAQNQKRFEGYAHMERLYKGVQAS